MTYFLDLFSGIGGFALGAAWAGLHFGAHYFSEVDDYAVRNYQRRFPDAIPLGDIRGIHAADLPAGAWIIAGGFPCQDISLAGKGAGLEGSRSGLWFEYARLIGDLRPRYAIMENVGALVSRGLDRVLGSLAALGYDAEWQDIRASDVGAPHRRERIWIVAYPKGAAAGSGYDLLEGKSDARASGGDVPDPDSGRAYPESESVPGSIDPIHISGHGTVLNVADASRELRKLYPRSREERPGTADARGNGEAVSNANCTRLEEREGRQAPQRSYSESYRSNQWTTEPDVGRVAHGIPDRIHRLKCLGNSIVPQIAELIFSQAAFDEWRAA